MDPVVDFISRDMVRIDGVLYKRQLTDCGRHSKASRAQYMRIWRAKKQRIL